MKARAASLALVFLLAVLAGCTTVYKAAVDERSVGTMASDTKIKATILGRFIDDETIKTLDISASSYEGQVYLVGEYEKQAQKSRAIEIAKGVEGVKGVTSYFLPKKENDKCPNLELTAKVKANLIGDTDIWSTNVDVKTMQCTVVLWGLVGSKAEVDRAVGHAKSVEGVKQVKSFLRPVK
jgi:hyperosmotically inducible protein